MRRHERLEDEALDWLVRRTGTDWTDDDQADLDAWLDQSLAHKAAFWRADHGWRQLDRIRSLGFSWGFVTEYRPWTRWWRPAAVAAILLVGVTFAGMLSLSYTGGDQAVTEAQARFQTPLGERQKIVLVDGSSVELNTETVVRVDISDRVRAVWLDSGEAYFEIAHREGEPFLVYSGSKKITVLGTKFSVRLDKDKRVTVNVLEGRVRVEDLAPSSGSALIMVAGDTAMALETSTLISRDASERVKAALAWRDGLLSFDQAPLSQVVAEFNRYSETRLMVTDAEAARIPIGGSFKVSNQEAFVRLLSDAYGLRVEREEKVIRISSP